MQRQSASQRSAFAGIDIVNSWVLPEKLTTKPRHNAFGECMAGGIQTGRKTLLGSVFLRSSAPDSSQYRHSPESPRQIGTPLSTVEPRIRVKSKRHSAISSVTANHFSTRSGTEFLQFRSDTWDTELHRLDVSFRCRVRSLIID